MVDDGRVQVDVRGLPEGVKPRLKMLALEAGMSLTDFVRTLLCERVLKHDEPQPQHEGPTLAGVPTEYEPLR